jgi:hypothetical protein
MIVECVVRRCAQAGFAAVTEPVKAPLSLDLLGARAANNIVLVQIGSTAMTSRHWRGALEGRGVLTRPWDDRILRCVERKRQPADCSTGTACG